MKLEIVKTHGGYFRVYKIGKKIESPFSPREFLSKADARKWLKTYKRKRRKKK